MPRRCRCPGAPQWLVSRHADRDVNESLHRLPPVWAGHNLWIQSQVSRRCHCLEGSVTRLVGGGCHGGAVERLLTVAVLLRRHCRTSVHDQPAPESGYILNPAYPAPDGDCTAGGEVLSPWTATGLEPNTEYSVAIYTCSAACDEYSAEPAEATLVRREFSTASSMVGNHLLAHGVMA